MNNSITSKSKQEGTTLRSKPKKVIVISDVHSDYIEQAILILKPEKKEVIEKDFLVKEATAIIDNYNKRLPAERTQPAKGNKNPMFPTLFMVVSLTVLAAVILLALLMHL